MTSRRIGMATTIRRPRSPSFTVPSLIFMVAGAYRPRGPGYEGGPTGSNIWTFGGSLFWEGEPGPAARQARVRTSNPSTILSMVQPLLQDMSVPAWCDSQSLPTRQINRTAEGNLEENLGRAGPGAESGPGLAAGRGAPV